MEGTMPVRFRRTFTIFPGVKVNVSKGGTSITVGKRGFHLNFSKRGVKQTVGLPGSGISQTSYLYKNDPDDEAEKKEEASAEAAPARKRRRTRRTKREAAPGRSSPWGFFLFIFIAIFLIYVGGVFLGVLPASNLITQFLQLLTQWAQQIGL
jgi:hypothetical protein